MSRTLQLSIVAIGTGLVIANTSQAQQSVGQPSLQVVAPATVANVGYAVVGTDAQGRQIIETNSAHVLSEVGYHWVYNFNGILGSYNAPIPKFNVTGAGTMMRETTAPSANASVPGLTDLQAGLNALSDGSNGGCAIALCLASPVSVAQCEPVLGRLASIIRNGGQKPSCNGTSIDYVPYTCAAPWALVSKGSWMNYACQATLQATGPSMAEHCARTFANQLMSYTVEGYAYQIATNLWAEHDYWVVQAQTGAIWGFDNSCYSWVIASPQEYYMPGHSSTGDGGG